MPEGPREIRQQTWRKAGRGYKSKCRRFSLSRYRRASAMKEGKGWGRSQEHLNPSKEGSSAEGSSPPSVRRSPWLRMREMHRVTGSVQGDSRLCVYWPPATCQAPHWTEKSLGWTGAHPWEPHSSSVLLLPAQSHTWRRAITHPPTHRHHRVTIGSSFSQRQPCANSPLPSNLSPSPRHTVHLGSPPQLAPGSWLLFRPQADPPRHPRLRSPHQLPCPGHQAQKLFCMASVLLLSGLNLTFWHHLLVLSSPYTSVFFCFFF